MIMGSTFLKKLFTILMVSVVMVVLIENFVVRLSDLDPYKSLMNASKFIPSLMGSLANSIGGGSKSGKSGNLLVDTPSCTIPATKIFYDYYIQNWPPNKTFHKIPDCSEFKKFFTLVEIGDDKFAKFYDDPKNESCHLWEVIRDPKADQDYLSVDLGPVTTTYLNVTSLEMFMVNCNGSYNYETTIPIRPDVQQKIDYWRHKPKAVKPISIMIIGTDTVSRSHAYRSLPRTRKLFEEMGFVDFQGFHSIYTWTLRNWLALHFGLTKDQVRAGCQESWSDPVDDCPFIWKDFDRHHYVTLFIEDTIGLFNWGGDSGFTNKPTDYYIKPIFRAIHSHRDDTDCFSSETVTQFEFRYLTRFLDKFNGTPTFSFTWLNYPFHDEDESLLTSDEDFAHFFAHLQSRPDILSSTLILWWGDHGTKTSLAGPSSIEGLLEKSLPALFIRLPEQLLADHPEFSHALKINSKRLTTTFDIHHTLLHILDLDPNHPRNHHHHHHRPKLYRADEKKFYTKKFEPVWPNRSSLLTPVFKNRTCALLNIDPYACVCNATDNARSLDNPYLSKRIHQFALDELNAIIERSKYKDLCEELEEPDDPKVFVTVIEETSNYSVILFNFDTDEDSRFEVQIRVVYGEKSDDDKSAGSDGQVKSSTPYADHFELMGEFIRTNLYGDQSWCVGFETDEDKRMKSFCMCNEDKPDDDELTTTITTTTTTEVDDEVTTTTPVTAEDGDEATVEDGSGNSKSTS